MFTVSTSCNVNSYAITEGAVTTPQNVIFSDSTVGFVLPSYTSAQAACSVATRDVSTSGSSLVTTSTLGAPTVSGANYIVKPSNTGMH